MIPSRGLRWSSQTLGIGRRRIEIFSARQFSSSVQYGSFRASPLSSTRSSLPRGTSSSQFSRTSTLIRNGAGIRFASTTPIAPVTQAAPVAGSLDAVGSSTGPLSSFNETTDLISDSLYNVPEHIGYLKELGLDYGWGPTAIMEWILEHVHIIAGTPWWASIALTAILVRATVFPAMVISAENAAKIATITPITKPIRDKMQAAQRTSDTETFMACRRELSIIHKRAGIRYWATVMPMVQIFTGFGTFVLLRAMAKLPVPGFETGGFLWFQNLSIPDPFFVLPLATSAAMHWVFRKGGEQGVNSFSPGVMKVMMWGLPGLSLAFTWWLPASVQISFFMTGILSYLQSALFRQAWFRKRFNMTPLPPKVGAAAPNPYKGNMKITASPVLSQAEVSQRYSSTSKSPRPSKSQSNVLLSSRSARSSAADAAAQDAAQKAGILSSTLQNLKGTLGGLKSGANEIVEKGKTQMSGTKIKSEKRERDRYEAKRAAELKKQRWEAENDRRAERAARRAAQNEGD